MAYLPDEPMVYDKLKPLEYLELVAGLWECDPHKAAFRASELLNLLELDQHKNELVEGFSRGMKQKLGLAGALIHEPQLIILDEPLTGLDVAAARKVKDLLLMHVRQGGTVILTTHILEVAEQLATRVGIVYQGALLVEGTLSELQSHAKREGASLESLFLTLTEMGN
jgi:ABC-2 type transport system ATP-binding protein